MLINEAVLKAELGGIQASLNWKTLEPFAKIANRNFRKQIGVELYNELIKPNTNLTELKEIAVGVVAWQSYDLAFPHLKMKVGDLGLMKSSPQNTVAITKWEYVDSREANLQVVDKLLEDFLSCWKWRLRKFGKAPRPIKPETDCLLGRRLSWAKS
jgi:hypothetical protein